MAWRIECECGQVLPLDKRTECSACGAHYEIKLRQVVPPIGDE